MPFAHWDKSEKKKNPSLFSFLEYIELAVPCLTVRWPWVAVGFSSDHATWTLIYCTLLCPEVLTRFILPLSWWMHGMGFPVCHFIHYNISHLSFLFLHSGFCIEVMCALTVLVASNVGIPISSTHCKVLEFVVVTLIKPILKLLRTKRNNS